MSHPEHLSPGPSYYFTPLVTRDSDGALFEVLGLGRELHDGRGDMVCLSKPGALGYSRVHQATLVQDFTAHPAPSSEDTRPRVWQEGDDPGTDRALLVDAITYVTRTQNGAPTAVQRNIRVGWAKACRLIDLMETWGVVGPSRGSAARAVFLGAEQGKALVAHLSVVPTPGGTT